MDPDNPAPAPAPAPGSALPRDLLLRVLSFLPQNALALSGRLTCKDAAQHFSQPQHLTVYLSQPLPPTDPAIAWALDKATQGVTSLSFRRQLLLLCTAAASGSKSNLNLVLYTLQPRVLPELLSSGPAEHAKLLMSLGDPGVSAAKAGHPHLLPWLLSHCPGLVDPAKTLAAVARHCSLEALQQAWQELQGSMIEQGVDSCTGNGSSGDLWQGLLDAAAECVLPEGSSKLEWVLGVGAGHCHVRFVTLSAAVRSGDVGRVKWLVQGRQDQQEQGQGQGSGQEQQQQEGHDQEQQQQQQEQELQQQEKQQEQQKQQLWAGEAAIQCILDAALQHADLGLIEWLVDEAGCPLPGPNAAKARHSLCWNAAASGDPSRLRWLEARGLPVRRGPAVHGAASGGHLELLQQLLQEARNNRENVRDLFDKELSQNAVMSGCVRTTAWLLQQGCPIRSSMCASAMLGGCKEMVLLTARETRVRVDAALLKKLIRLWPDGAAAVNDSELCEVLEALVLEHGGQLGLDGLPLCAAAGRGHLPLVHKIMSLGQGVLLLPTRHLLQHAADGGCGDVLMWVEALRIGGDGWGGGGGGNGPLALANPWPWSALVKALVRGDLATAEFLVSHGVDMPPEALAMATEGGCTRSALQWLVGQGVAAGQGEARRAWQVAEEADVRLWLWTLVEEGEEGQGEQEQGQGEQGQGQGDEAGEGEGERGLLGAAGEAVGEAEARWEAEEVGAAEGEGEQGPGEQGEGQRGEGVLGAVGEAARQGEAAEGEALPEVEVETEDGLVTGLRAPTTSTSPRAHGPPHCCTVQ